MKHITRRVWILSLISLFTDTASEMLYPIMPVYLKSIGFSIILIGVLEGFAEAIAGLCKGYFGKLSDNTGKRVPFVQWGYTLSAISKPLMAVFTYPFWIFCVRSVDRLGKGIRTGARDALLSDEATPQTKGKVFGFHRSMDTTGAVLGPALALLYLNYFPLQYKTLFYIAFLPGLCAIGASFYLKEKAPASLKIKTPTSFLSFLNYWKVSPVTYKKIVIGLLVFTLFNSSDVFLLLKVKQSGISDTMLIAIYIFYNMVFAIFAFPVGIIADKFGLKNIFISGLVVFSIVYFGMSVNDDVFVYFGLFFLYGIYAAATEGISKAWISNVTNKRDTATAIGTFSGFQSICTMIASSLTGWIWYKFGSDTAFIITSLATIIVMGYFLIAIPPLKTLNEVADIG
ncbi:MAG: MFS transporter [Segetibacter sp.]|nr:MFS transporter [Segetibacter sp.]